MEKSANKHYNPLTINLLCFYIVILNRSFFCLFSTVFLATDST